MSLQIGDTAPDFTALQLTAKNQVATPVNWKQGEDVIIIPAVTDEDARKKFPGGWSAPKPYLRIVPQPEREAGCNSWWPDPYYLVKEVQ
jgi:hypothetical protein